MYRILFHIGSEILFPFSKSQLLLPLRRASRQHLRSAHPFEGSFGGITSRAFWFAGQVFKYSVVLYIVNAYAVDFFICIGGSMEPTIHPHDLVITEHFTQRWGVLERGDLVIARSPVNPHTFVCKRIVAKTDDLVYDEHENLVKIPKGYVWLEGDNADDSIDSRRYGPIPEALVRSKVQVRLWPLSKFGWIADFKRPLRPGESIDSF